MKELTKYSNNIAAHVLWIGLVFLTVEIALMYYLTN